MASSLAYKRFRAPREDGGLLLEPAWSDCRQLVHTNAQEFTACDFALHSRSFQQLREQVRGDILRLAQAYSSRYVDTSQDGNTQDRLVVSGHQPTLFHPGVWAKNFAIDRLAAEENGRAIQIIVDNDTMRGHSLLCPGGSVEDPYRVAESFDEYQSPTPYENRFVLNEDLFRSFGQRVADRIRSHVSDPLITRIWPTVCEGVAAGMPIGQAFAQSRHCLERKWGLKTLELPLSQVCETLGFRWFALHLMLRATDVYDSYNRRLSEYRQVHRLRNLAQPLPNLRRSAGWIETPFWIWNDRKPQRQGAFVRRIGSDLELSSFDRTLNYRLPKAGTQMEMGLDSLAELRGQGLCLRPRALANTLFLRMFLADVFLHGIGGAKYDQVTDLIIQDLFGVTPPGYAVLSLTAFLPSKKPLVPVREIIHKRRNLRQMYFHPERFFDSETQQVNQVSSKAKKKQNLLSQKPPRGEAQSWHQELAMANEELRGFLQEKTDAEREKLLDLVQQARRSELFLSREWSFCLFPEDDLKTRLLDLDCENR